MSSSTHSWPEISGSPHASLKHAQKLVSLLVRSPSTHKSAVSRSHQSQIDELLCPQVDASTHPKDVAYPPMGPCQRRSTIGRIPSGQSTEREQGGKQGRDARRAAEVRRGRRKRAGFVDEMSWL